MKLSKIAFSNIKKRKSSAITLAAITTMAVLMLSISLMLLFGIGSFYETKAAETNTPHITLLLNGYSNDDLVDISKYAKNYSNVKETEEEDSFMANIKYDINNTTVKTQMLFSKEFPARKMSTYTVIDELSIKPTNGIGIILPLSFKFEGFKSGEKFSFHAGSNTYDFTIYGFYENVQFGSAMSNIKMVYLTTNALNKISSDNNFRPYKVIGMMFADLSDSYDFEPNFIKEFEGSNGFHILVTYDNSKGGVTMFPTIMAMVLILVAVIIVIVALVIARFTIINNIEEDIKTLGALKSIGFTHGQIKLSMVLQFLIIAITGALFGAILTVALGGVIGNLISSTSGLLWNGASAIIPIILSVLSVIGIIVLITYLMARRSKKVTPINALRSGLSHHSFVKNTAPLEKSKLSLNINIAVKHFRRNLKNNITSFIMVVMFAFMTVLGFTLYHNFVVDTNAFREMSGLEMGILIQFSDEFLEDDDNILKLEDIKNHSDIKKVSEFNYITLMADGKATYSFIWDDIEKKEGNAIVDGRYPKANNEIAIPASLAAMTGKKVDDTISLELEGKPQTYLITGITQTPGNPSCDLTKEGFSRLKEDFKFAGMYVYLNNNNQETVDNFMNFMSDNYGRDMYMENSSEIMDMILGTIGGPVGIATYFILAIEAFVIIFVFFLMITTVIRRAKKEAGILKAVGFTSNQLILQMLLSLIPVIIGGAIIGTLLGVFLTNTLLGMMFGGLVAKATFTIPALLTVISEIVLIVVCLITVYLVSLKYKRISATKLIVEG